MRDDNQKISSVKFINDYLSIISPVVVTVATALVFFVGYFFLYGFYKSFNINVNDLDLNLTEYAISSAFPLILFLVFIGYISLFLYLNRNNTWGYLAKTIRLYATVLGVLVVPLFVMPPLGGMFANIEIKAQRNYVFTNLSPHIPYTDIYTDLNIINLTIFKTIKDDNKKIYIYKNLRLIAQTKDYFYVYNEHDGTYIIPRDKILFIRTHWIAETH